MLNRYRRRLDRRGVSVMEFALIAPAVLILIIGGAEFSIVLNEYITLTNAATVGATQFAFSAGVDSTPATDAQTQFSAAAASLTPAPTVTYVVNGTQCATSANTSAGDSACNTSLTAGSGYVTVTAKYSCAALNIYMDLLPACTLTAQATERVQ